MSQQRGHFTHLGRIRTTDLGTLSFKVKSHVTRSVRLLCLVNIFLIIIICLPHPADDSVASEIAQEEATDYHCQFTGGGLRE